MSLYDVTPVSVADYRLRARRRLPGFLFNYIDGGVRSGIDVVKALALGARGVLIGRPWVFAMAACGEDGIVKLLELIRQEIATAMALMGVTSMIEITGELISRLNQERP